MVVGTTNDHGAAFCRKKLWLIALSLKVKDSLILEKLTENSVNRLEIRIQRLQPKSFQQ